MKTMEATSVATSGSARRALVAAVGLPLAMLSVPVLFLHGPSRTSAAPASTRSEAPLRFSCGQLSCDPSASYCETINTDVPALPSNYACKPLPTGCRPRAGTSLDCSCFPPHTRGDYCSVRRDRGVQAFYRTSVGGH